MPGMYSCWNAFICWQSYWIRMQESGGGIHMWTWCKSGKVFIGAETETMASWRSFMSTFTNCRWVDITLYRVVIVAKNSLYGAHWADVNVYLLDFWIDTGRFDWQRHWWWSNQTQPELSKGLKPPTMLVEKNTHCRKGVELNTLV